MLLQAASALLVVILPPLPALACRCDDLERRLAKAQQVANSGTSQAAAPGPALAAASPRNPLPGEQEMLLAVRAAEERAAAADAVALDAQAHSEVGGRRMADGLMAVTPA